MARSHYSAGAAVYGDLVDRLATVDAGIADLDHTLRQIEAIGGRLPASLNLGPAPVSRATSGGSATRTSPVAAPALPPAPAAPPPVSGTTGASGG